MMKKIGLSLMVLMPLFVFAQKIKKEVFITSQEIWIDKFSTGKPVSNFGGNWFLFDDKSNGGLSKISPQQIQQGIKPIKERGGDNAMEVTFLLDRGNYKWEPYAGVGVNFSDSSVKISLEKIQGIAYDYKGPKHFFTYQLSSVLDYAHYKRMVPESEEWTTIFIPIAELKQPHFWGKPVPFEPEKVQALIWSFMGVTGDTGTLQIDNIRLLRKMPKLEPVIDKPVEQKKELKVTAPPMKRFVDTSVIIADWYGFQNAAYSLTFDDGLLSQTKYVAPLLDKYGIKGTFYIVTDKLENDTLKQPEWRYGYWSQFIKLYFNGHELGSHSATHPRMTTLDDGSETAKGSLYYELASPIKSIQERIPGYKPITFAYPFVDFNVHVTDVTAQYYTAARGLGSGINPRVPSQWMNIQAHSVDYQKGRTLESDKLKMENLIFWIKENTIARRGWSVFLAHDIFPFEEAIAATDCWQPQSLEAFEYFVQWLNDQQSLGNIWVATMEDVTKYIKEREAVNVVLKSKMEDKLVYEITDPLDNSLFDMPISLEIKLPKGWAKLEVTQNNKLIPVEVLTGRARINVMPDGGDVEMVRLK